MTTIISSLSYLCWISVEFYLHFRHISFQFACVKWTFLITAFIVTVHIIQTFQKTICPCNMYFEVFLYLYEMDAFSIPR